MSTEGFADHVRNKIRTNPDTVILVALMMVTALLTWGCASIYHADHRTVIQQLQAENLQYASQVIGLRQTATTAYQEGLEAGRRSVASTSERSSGSAPGSVTVVLGEWASGEHGWLGGQTHYQGRGLAIWVR